MNYGTAELNNFNRALDEYYRECKPEWLPRYDLYNCNECCNYDCEHFNAINNIDPDLQRESDEQTLWNK